VRIVRTILGKTVQAKGDLTLHDPRSQTTSSRAARSRGLTYRFTPPIMTSTGITQPARVLSGDDTGELAAPRLGGLCIFTLGQFHMLLPSSGNAGELRKPNWPTNQAPRLLKCLVASQGCRCSREELMEHLWPEQDAVQARDSLSHALSRLRRALEPDPSAYDTSHYSGSDREAVWLMRGQGGITRRAANWVRECRVCFTSDYSRIRAPVTCAWAAQSRAGWTNPMGACI
jgi:hypothetical protein